MTRPSLARRVAVLVGLLVAAGPLMWSQSACDLSGDSAVNVVDVQLAVNMAFGLIPCTANINGSGVCTVVTVQRVVNASFPGGQCVTDAGTPAHTVTLTWTASTSPNVSGYNVYRGTASGGPYTKVNSALITGQTNYLDTTVQAGLTYYYVATAMDTSSNESAYSNQAQAVIPSP